MNIEKIIEKDPNQFGNFEIDYSSYLEQQEIFNRINYQIVNVPKQNKKKKIKKDRLAVHDKYVGKGGYLRFIEDQIRWYSKTDISEEKMNNKIIEWANNHRPDLIQDNLKHLRELHDSKWHRFDLKFNDGRPGSFGAAFSLSIAGIYAIYQSNRIIYFGTAINLRQRFIQHIFPLNENLKTPLNKYLKGTFKEIKIAVKKMDKKFERLTKEGCFIHKIKPIVNTHYKICES